METWEKKLGGPVLLVVLCVSTWVMVMVPALNGIAEAIFCLSGFGMLYYFFFRHPPEAGDGNHVSNGDPGPCFFGGDGGGHGGGHGHGGGGDGGGC